MTRRKSFFDDLPRLPWWLILILAAVVYFGLRYYLSTIEFTNPALQFLGKSLPNMADLFAGIFVFTAAISGYHAWRKGELLDGQTSAKSIMDLTRKDFVYLVSEAYRQQGYTVQEYIAGDSDGGIDLVLSKYGNCTLIQCKNWKFREIDVMTIRELFGVMTAEGAAAGIVVCSGEYSNEAVEFTKGKPITLVDGQALSRLIGNTQKSSKMQPVLKHTICPVCLSPMVLRTAKRGNNAGRCFWECSQYPKCRGTRSA